MRARAGHSKGRRIRGIARHLAATLPALFLGVPLLATSTIAVADISCQDDICVDTYAGFDADLASILARQDNKIRLVDTAKKGMVVDNVIAFAGSIGIPKSAIKQMPGGRLYGKTVFQGEIDAYFKRDPEPDLRANAVLKARKTTRFRQAAPPQPDSRLRALADAAIAQWRVPMLHPQETLAFASYIHSREVDEVVPATWVITQRVGYFRAFGDRQVVNSALKVEINPSANAVSGLSLAAFWPVRAAQATPLKPFAAAQGDVLKALRKNGSRRLTLSVGSCRATYFQAPTVLIPTVTCYGQFVNPVDNVRDDDAESIAVNVSLASSYSLDEADAMSVIQSTYPDDDDTAATRSHAATCAERTGFAFHAYYTTDENRFYDGAEEFYEDFDTSSREANLGKAWRDSRFVEGQCDDYGADWSDLVYVTAHGSLRQFTGENGGVYLARSITDELSQLGNGDAEYLISASCNTGSAIYCEGRTAVSRYTEQSSYHSVFNGLHIFSGHHGTSIHSSSSRHRDRAETLSEYLNDGLTIVESWEDTADDISKWDNNANKDCGVMDDPATGCSFEKPWDDCARWSAYASSFYQDGKRYVTMNNRSSYSDDVDPGETGYDIDLRYQYQSETVPIYSPGHSLP